MKQQCVVVDDEPLAQRIIESYIERIPFLEHQQTFENAFDTLNYLHQNKVDILFLDINMPELSGLDLLASLNHRPNVILTTAYSEYGAQSYEYDVVDYLLKPIPFERFLKAVNKVLQRKNSITPTNDTPAPTEIIIEHKGGQKKVAVSDILLLEAYGNFCKLYMLNEDSFLLWATSLKKAMELLPKSVFIRVHRSYTINIKQVELIKTDLILLKNQQEVPIGKSYKQAVINQLL